MSRMTRALAATLVAALAIPPTAAAQEPGGPAAATAADADPRGEVRLPSDGRRPSNPWAVFGSGLAVAVAGQSDAPGVRVDRGPAGGAPPGPSRLSGIEPSPAAVAKGRLAAKRGAGQTGGPLQFNPNTPTVVVVLVTVACVILVLLARGDPTDVFARR